MRIAFIKKRFFLYGGAERYLQTLIGELRDSGHEVHILANQWVFEEEVIFHRVKIIPFPSFLSILTFNINSGLKIKDPKFDCIISFERTTHQDIYRAGDGCHREWLKIRSQYEPLYKWASFKINPLHRLLLNLEKKIFTTTRLIIANSKMVKEQIIRHYAVPEDKIKVIYNGVDLERFHPRNKDLYRNNLRESLGIPKDVKVLIFVGSGFGRKGLLTLIKAIALIKEADLYALVIGKGDTDQYRMLAKELGIPDKILFLGIHRDIQKFYAVADLFVLPTLYDPFSNATLEAMASGIAVITTKNNGVAEIIDNGKEGYIMDRLSDPQELAERINHALSNDNMGKMARQKAERFCIEEIAKTFEREILNLSHGTSL